MELKATLASSNTTHLNRSNNDRVNSNARLDAVLQTPEPITRNLGSLKLQSGGLRPQKVITGSLARTNLE